MYLNHNVFCIVNFVPIRNFLTLSIRRNVPYLVSRISTSPAQLMMDYMIKPKISDRMPSILIALALTAITTHSTLIAPTLAQDYQKGNIDDVYQREHSLVKPYQGSGMVGITKLT